MLRNLITFMIIAGFLLLPAGAKAQQEETGPYLVRDINTHTSVYNKPLELMEAGPVSYFFASGGQGSFGLWKTDGTQAGTDFVKEMGLGTQDNGASSDLSALLGGFLFFGAAETASTSERHGIELWRTDGTAQGTSLFADLVPGEGSSKPRKFVEMNGSIYFIAGLSIWRLDGPDALPVHIWGEILDEDHNETIYSLKLYVLGDSLFFSWYQAESGRELWVSDGTAEGTHLLVDLNPGADSSNASPLLAWHGQLYFSADDGNTGTELWVYEAASGEVSLVDNINTSGGSSPGALVPVSGVIYFPAYEPASGRELFRLDEDMVTRVLDLNPGAASSSPGLVGAISTPAGDRLLFSARGADQVWGLYTSDGTEPGTMRILISEPAQASTLSGITSNDTASGIDQYQSSSFYQGSYYFAHYTSENGLELWRTDGSAAGTKLLKDIWPGPKDGYPFNFGKCGIRLCFSADDGDHGSELWSTDGSPESTAMVADLNDDAPGSSPSGFTAAGSLVYFLADDGTNGTSLWRTDGTGAGTIPLLSSMPFYTGPSETFIPAGSRIYFTTMDDAHGEELWYSGGTPGTTRMLKDIYPGAASSSPWLMTARGNDLFFTAIDHDHGRELWKTNGTAAGTVMVADLNNGLGSTDIRGIYPFGAQVVFTMYRESSSRYELWLSDGTLPGTKKIADIDRPASHQSFVEANGLLFFVTGIFQENTLWQTDGTGPGTLPIPVPACLGSYGEIRGLAEMGGELYFINSDWNSPSYPEIPLVLARTRGAQPGIECVWSTSFLFGDGGVSYEIGPMVVHGSHLVFNVPEPGFQQHLMISDGTPNGTRAFPGEVNRLSDLISAGPFLYFRGSSPAEGEELWVLSSDTNSASLVMDIFSGAASSSPANFTYRSGHLYFSADDGQHGRELWAYTIPAERLYLPAVSR